MASDAITNPDPDTPLPVSAPPDPTDEIDVEADLEEDADLDIDPNLAATLGFTSFGSHKNKRGRHGPHVESVEQNSDTSHSNNRKRKWTPTEAPHTASSAMPPPTTDKSSTIAATTGTTVPTTVPTMTTTIPHRSDPSQSTTNPSHSVTPHSILDQAPSSHQSPPTQQHHQYLDKRLADLSPSDLQHLRAGVRIGPARGDVAYFLPSFVEDPWVELELDAVRGTVADADIARLGGVAIPYTGHELDVKLEVS